MKEMSGVDIPYVCSKAMSDLKWEMGRPNGWDRWCQNLVGLRDSPYRSIQLLINLKMEA